MAARNQYGTPYFSLLKLKDITAKKDQDALNDLKEKGYVDNTLDGVHRTGRMIFKKAIEMRLIKNDSTEQQKTSICYVTKEMKKEASHKFAQLMRNL